MLYWCRTKVFRRTSPQISNMCFIGAAQRRSGMRARKSSAMCFLVPPKGALTRQATNLRHMLFVAAQRRSGMRVRKSSATCCIGAEQKCSDVRARKPLPCAVLVPNKSVPAHEPANLPSWHFSKPNQRYLHPQGGTAVQKLAIAKPKQVSPPAGGNGSIRTG